MKADDQTNGTTDKRIRGIPRSVWALGFVSMLMDISSEMIHALLPIYMVTVLGTSVIMVGIIEGIAEATASITKVFSGALSDWLGKRKLLAVIGYGLGALTKPVFPMGAGIDWLVGARFIDRVGKGIRGAPRDALVADVTPPELRGAAYGLRQTLDSFGAFLGPLLAIALMWTTSNHFQTVFWIAVIPAFFAIYVLIRYVREPRHEASPKRVRWPLNITALQTLGAGYWWVVGLAVVFTLARFSEAFLILRAQAVGLPIYLAPAVLVIMALAFSVSAYPAGLISDRLGRNAVLSFGLATLIVADLVLAFLPGIIGLTLGTALWGLHMGFTQGIFGAMVADSAPKELRGTAFGMFHLVTGVALLAASILAGLLWESVGYTATFTAGAAFAATTLLGLFLINRQTHVPAQP